MCQSDGELSFKFPCRLRYELGTTSNVLRNVISSSGMRGTVRRNPSRKLVAAARAVPTYARNLVFPPRLDWWVRLSNAHTHTHSLIQARTHFHTLTHTHTYNYTTLHKQTIMRSTNTKSGDKGNYLSLKLNNTFNFLRCADFGFWLKNCEAIRV